VAAVRSGRAWPSSCPPASVRVCASICARTLTTRQAVQRSLAGGNESARVAAVKFLADLELYRRTATNAPAAQR
jgi:hypothetical protein